MEFKTTIRGNEAVQATLRAIADRMVDATPAMRSISMVLLRETERIFEREGKGVGLDQEWAPLSEVTKHRRALAKSGGRQYGKRGKELSRYTTTMASMKILQASGQLAKVQARSSATSAGVTTNKEYAATMFFGAKKGEFGSDRRGRPVPWGDIPGRVFFPVRGVGTGEMQLTDTARESVLHVLATYLEPPA